MINLAIGVDKAIIGRLTIGGQKFEILVDPNIATLFKKGDKVSISDALAYPVIYKDARTSEASATQDLQKAFGTTDPLKIAERIIKTGEMQLTTEQRREMVSQKKMQIASIISKKAINPQTNAPHPPQRILGVMDQVGVNIDPMVDAEIQVDKVVKEIKTIIPLKFEKLILQIKIGPQYSGKVYSVFKSAGTVKSEQWLNDGSLQVSIEILAGVQEELFKKIADLTHGQYESKVLQHENI